MSKIGKQIIKIPEKVKVTKVGEVLEVNGPNGNLSNKFKDDIIININDTDRNIKLEPKRNDKFSKSLWGTYASIIKSMINGVQNSYEKKLILEGVGYKSDVKDEGKESFLHLALGFSHPVIIPVPKGLTVVAKKNNITITGADKQLVGNFSASIRSLKKPEPYKGKGFHYEGEIVRRKQGKKTK